MNNEILIELNRCASLFNDEKKKLLNNKYLIKLLFDKPLHNRTKCIDMKIDYDCELSQFTISNNNILDIFKKLFIMSESRKHYDAYYELYEKKHAKYKINHEFGIMNKFEKTIAKCLDSYASKYNLYYFYNWSFYQTGDDRTSHNCMDEIQINSKNNFTFYGILIHNNSLHHFCILNDDIKKSYVDRVFEQYQLFNLNCHLLRLKKDINCSKMIKHFLKKIIIEKMYITINNILPNKNKLSNENHNGLKLFNADYARNHIICVKQKIDCNTISIVTDTSCDYEVPGYRVDKNSISEILKSDVVFP